MQMRMGAKIITRGPNTKYGRMKMDMRGGRDLSTPNRITAAGVGLKRRLNGT